MGFILTAAGVRVLRQPQGVERSGQQQQNHDRNPSAAGGGAMLGHTVEAPKALLLDGASLSIMMAAMIQPRQTTDRRPLALLAALLALHVATNLIWLAQTTSVEIGLPHNHLFQALDHALDLPGDGAWGQPDSFVYPLSSFFVRLLGPSYLSVTFVHTFFFLIAILGVFCLGRALRDSWTGLSAATLFSFMPAAYGMSRLYSDLPLATAAAAWALWALWRAARGWIWGWALAGALIVVAAYGMFVPSNTVLIALALAGPTCAALVAAYRRSGRGGRVVVAAVFAFVAGVTLLQIVSGALFENYYFKESARFADVSLWRHPHYVITQLVLLGGYVLRPLLALALIVGTVLAFRNKSEGRWFLLLGVVVPLVVLTLVPKRKDLNLFPLLPAAAVLTAMGLAQLRRARPLIAGLVAVAFLQFAYHTVTPYSPARLVDALRLSPGLEAPPYPWATAPYRHPPAHRAASAIVAEAARRYPPATRSTVHLVSMEEPRNDALQFELALMDRRIIYHGPEWQGGEPAVKGDLLLVPAGVPVPPGAEKIAATAFYGLYLPNSE
ncbi:MAG: hypothetical protein P9L99_06880 [Candidatus Lernaella stagnicola]|nr:hypothetical protein [Candidatus Lernaella stagnicola]